MKFILTFIVTVVWLSCSLAGWSQDVIINEVQSSNVGTTQDADGEFEDWVELRNISNFAVSLEGWSIQNAEGQSFTFPNDVAELLLEPGEYMLLYADDEVEEGWNHLSFRIAQEGDALYLYRPDDSLEHFAFFDFLWADSSLGINDLGNWAVFDLPTPGFANSATFYQGILSPPHASVESGFFSNTFTVSLSHPSADAQLFYTTDGSWPDVNSELYSLPLTIDQNTTLKVVAVQDDFLQSRVLAESYLFTPPLALDVIALSGEEDDIFGLANGIYSHPFLDAEAVVSAVYLSTEGEKQFSQIMGMQIHGPDGRDQKSLRLSARGMYGYTHLNYPLFPDREVEQYKRFILRNAGNDGVELGLSGMRDAVIHNLYRSIDNSYGASAALGVHVFLNDQYWGIYNLRERQDQFWMEELYGYEEDEVDLLERTATVSSTYHAILGDWEDYDLMKEVAIELDLSDAENFAVMEDWMDVDNFIDYQFMEIFAINQDWLSNNLKLWRSYDEGGKWRWILWDVDWGFGRWYPSYPHGFPDWNALSFSLSNWGGWTSDVETELFQNLVENDDFMRKFCSRGADLLNANLRSDKVIETLDAYKTPIQSDLSLQTDKWGSSVEEWEEGVEYIEEFVTLRPEALRQNFTEYFDLGEVFEIHLEVEQDNAGYIEVNTIRTDAEPWMGYYYEAIPVRLKAVAYPGFSFSHWQETGETTAEIWVDLDADTWDTAVFDPAPVPEPLVVNELMYNALGNDNDREWVELYNPNDFTVNLSGWQLCDESGSCSPLSGQIPSLEYAVFCADSASFANQYPEVTNFHGGLTLSLSNEGEWLELIDSQNNTVDYVDYKIQDPWPEMVEGASIQWVETSSDNNWGSNWFSNLPGLETPGNINLMMVGIPTLLSPADVLLYPNPAHDYFSLLVRGQEGKSLRMEVYSVMGKLLFAAKEGVLTQKLLKVEVDVSDWPRGMYLVKLAVGDEAWFKKIVVE